MIVIPLKPYVISGTLKIPEPPNIDCPSIGFIDAWIAKFESEKLSRLVAMCNTPCYRYKP